MKVYSIVQTTISFLSSRCFEIIHRLSGYDYYLEEAKEEFPQKKRSKLISLLLITIISHGQDNFSKPID